MNYWHDRCMSGKSKILNTETGLINYQHATCMSCGKKMSTDTGFSNCWHDRCMSGESKYWNGYRLNELLTWQVHAGWNQNVRNRQV